MAAGSDDAENFGKRERGGGGERGGNLYSGDGKGRG
jgi:hypothetical protein